MTRNIYLDQIVVFRKSLYKAFDDCEAGRCSKSQGPIEVLPIRKEPGKFQLIDGHHRLVEYLVSQNHIKNNHKIRVKVVDEEWVQQYYAVAPEDERWEYDSSLKYGNLEDLADEEIVDDLAETLQNDKSLDEINLLSLKDLLLFVESVEEEEHPSVDEILNAGLCEEYNGYFYHVTPARNLDSILKKGIRPSSGKQVSFPGLNKWSKGKIFISSNFNDAQMWQEMIFDMLGEDIAIIRLDLTDRQINNLKLDKISFEEDDPCSFYLTSTIQPSQIQIVDTGEGMEV